VKVLVTGATGYIGGRLVPHLLEAGHEVRCAVRSPAKLAGRPWRGDVEVVAADLFDPASLAAAAEGMDAVHYLVHAMDGEGDFERRDREAAENLRVAAEEAGVARIVYLGGLGGSDGAPLSKHLRSRQEVGRILAAGEVPVTELRAAVIIGSGSASFEMLRHLVEVLPMMVTPRWVDTRCQPIAIRDVLHYLVAVLDIEATAGRVLELGGPQVLTYREMMHTYASVAGLRRRIIVPVPVLTPRLSSLWVGLVTPLPTGLARPLVDSLVNEVVVTDPSLEQLVALEPLPLRRAIELALAHVQDLDVATTWASAGRPGEPGSVPEDPRPEDPDWSGGTVLADERVVTCSAPPEVLFRAVTSLGGQTGWRSARWLWELRGLIDKLVGGIGVRRGRRHPVELAVGEAVDLWRVEALEPPTLLRLRAEMRLPGEAWLEFRIEPRGNGSQLVQRARFHPRGLWGRVYWWTVAPFHGAIFPRMARGIARDAEARAVTEAGRRP
jgi:uncharacterized protein YbjT (DUF2867 family)